MSFRMTLKTADRSRLIVSFPLNCHPRDEAADVWLPSREDREILNFPRMEGGIRLAFSWQVWPAVAQRDAPPAAENWRKWTNASTPEELKIQLEFNRTAAQIGEAVSGGEVSL